MKQNFRLTKLACYISYIVQAIVVNLAPLFFVIFREKYGLSFAELGFLVLFTFVVQLAVDIVSMKLVDVFGYKNCALGANISACIGIIMLSVLPRIMPALPALLISVFFYAIGGGLIEVMINPIIEAIPSDSVGATFSLLHSFYSWGQTAVILITTALLFVVGDDNWNHLPIIWALVPLVNSFLMYKAPMPKIEDEGHSASHAGTLLKSPIFYVFLLLMVCGGSTEMVISQWASYFAEKGLGVTKIIGDLLGPCIFALMMALGRTAFGIWGKKIPIFKGLLFCSFLGILSYLGIGLIPSPVLVMVCFALSGIASSLLWPGTLSASSEAIPHGGTAMFALLAFAGDAGCSLGPWINGLINDFITANESAQVLTALGFSPEQASLRSAIIVSGIFPAVMFITLLVLVPYLKKKSKDALK
ncbi:MAG: MFS transporter [Clostridia bacterium]|nr:MFS transporter [Clostridia bacterium]